MKTITKSVIKLSEIPEELQMSNQLLLMTINSNVIHTYAEFHIDGDEHDALTLWLLEKYPTLKRKISFFIHIDI
jgi:hypothetical protein